MKRLLVLWLLIRAFGSVWIPRWSVPQTHPWRVPGRLVFVGDQEFLVRQIGKQDAPDITLIHGLGGASLAEWYEIGPRLAESYRINLVDHRGHGHSPRVVDSYEIADLADDVAAVLHQVGVHRTSVVGYSMGGTIAQELAHRHPNLVDRLVLIGTFVTHRPARRWLRWAGSLLLRGWERLTGIGTPEFRAGYLLATRAVDEAHARWLWDETHTRDIEAGARATLALLRFDSSSWVGSVRNRSLVVIPLRDQLVPPAWQYELAAALPNAEVLEVVGARHEAPLSHPEPITDGIIDFLSASEEPALSR